MKLRRPEDIDEFDRLVERAEIAEKNAAKAIGLLMQQDLTLKQLIRIYDMNDPKALAEAFAAIRATVVISNAK